MKKILILIALTLLTQNISFATSGACSSHSGVNCSAGASYTGHVQCNDRWENSSVLFSDAEECKVTPCNIESVQFAQGRSGQIGSGVGEAEINNCNKINTSISNVAPTNSNTSQSDWIIDAQKKADNVNNDIQTKFNAFCIKNNGAGSFWDSSLPADSNGTQCTKTKFQKCLENDILSYFSETSNSCVCLSGFKLNEKSKCEKEKIPEPVIEKETEKPTPFFSSPITKNLQPKKEAVVPAVKDVTKIEKKEIVIPVIKDSTKVVKQEIIKEVIATTSSQLKMFPESVKVAPQKHWYEWMNPFSWFK